MKKFNSWQIVLTGVLIIIAYKFIDNISYFLDALGSFIGILTPIIIGAVIAFFLSRPIAAIKGFIEKSKWKFLNKKAQALSIFIVYAAALGIIALFFKYIIPLIVKNIQDLIINAPSYYEFAKKFIEGNEFLSSAAAKLNIYEWFTKLLSTDNLNRVISLISGIANSFITSFLSIVLSIYMIIEKDGIFKFFKTAGRLIFREKIDKFDSGYIVKITDIFYSYFTGLALDAVIVGIISTVVLSIFNVPYPVLLGLIVTLGNLIPFFGSIIAAVCEYIVGAFAFGPVHALWIPLFQFILGQIDGNLLQPKILGESVGISPILVLISVIIFGDLFGALGMILGVPVVAAIKLVADSVTADKLAEERENQTHNPDEETVS